MGTKPFLKWAGGKHRLADRIVPLLTPAALPSATGRLIEPFAGSCALFLASPFERALLCDISADLIGLYTTLKADPMGFAGEVAALFVPDTNTEAAYKRLRDEFNAAPPGRRRAALFIYLNRHCFNGLCRYNSSGGFNVPFGRYKAPQPPLAAMADFVRRTVACEFRECGFESAMDSAVAGDVVYCDPPYLPLSATASFADYAKGGFSMASQEALADKARELAARGVLVIISNHDVPSTTARLYAGAVLHPVSVRRSISAGASSRGEVAEILAVFSPKISREASSLQVGEERRLFVF